MLLTAGVSPAWGAMPSGTDLVKATLVADVSSVKAGQPFTLGVLLKIEPGWHVYWKNPGDSGMATAVKWKLPEGFKVGELNFPIPIQFGQSGDVIGYGYKDEVLLTATVTPPNNLGPEKVQPFAADVAWLVCEKICIPGRTSVKIVLPLEDGSAAAPANSELFAKWKPRFPSAKVAKSGNETARSAFAKWDKAVKDIRWFPVPPPSSGIENIQTKTDGDVSTITFDLVPAPRDAAPMSFLVAWTDDNGKQQGAEFTVNLPPAK
jgi:DsbC/DsbD-like thiol-disulfide interchange protein